MRGLRQPALPVSRGIGLGLWESYIASRYKDEAQTWGKTPAELKLAECRGGQNKTNVVKTKISDGFKGTVLQ